MLAMHVMTQMTAKMKSTTDLGPRQPLPEDIPP
jgi:hypothetical protein